MALLRFTYTRREPAHEQPGALAGAEGDVAVVTVWKVDPADVVAVGGDPQGVVLLLRGHHAMRVDGTLEIVAAKVEAAKGALGGFFLGPDPEQIVRTEEQERHNEEARRRGFLQDPDEEPEGVEMMELHDGPAEVD